MTVLVCLTLLLVLLTAFVFGFQSFYIVGGLFLNSLVFIAILLCMAYGLPVYPLTLIGILLNASVTLFFVNQLNEKTLTAGISLLLFLGIFCLIALPLVQRLAIQGFSAEELLELYLFDFQVAVPFTELSMAIVLFSLSGAVIDGSIAVSSALYEIHQHTPQLTQKELFVAGMTIVKSILASTVNTLLFAFLGGSLALVFWFQDLDYSFGAMINSKAFVAEVAVILFTALGAIMILPLTAALASRRYTRLAAQNPKAHTLRAEKELDT